MSLLTRILAVDVPENTTLHSWEPSFRGLTPGWLAFLLAIVLAGAAGVAFFYLLEKGTLGWFRRVVLMGLRVSLLLLLLFLILRPVLLAEFVGHRPQGVALLIDNSQSMELRDRRLTDPDRGRVAMALGKLAFDAKLADKMPNLPTEAASNPPRYEIVKNVLKDPKLKLIDDLQTFGPLRPYYFGHDLREIEGDAKTPLGERIFADQKADKSRSARTALADSIFKILDTKESDHPSAIVIVTDGQDNASKFTLQEAAMKCAQQKVPLHIYGVGSSEGGQLQLKEVGAPDTLFVDDAVAVPLRWRAQGMKDGTVEVAVRLGGKEVFKKELNKKELPVQTGEDLRYVLAFTVPKDPEKRENQDLVATITYKVGSETFTETLTRTVRVADTKIKILYIEHSPRWEFKFLQPALVRDRRIQVDFILVNADEKVRSAPPYLQEFPKTREKFFDSKYNLIILGDVAASYFTKEQEEWIREFVQNRGGLIVMAGRQNMPASYENSPLAEVLPIEFAKQKFAIDSDVRTQEYPPTLTPDGQRTDWLALADTGEENNEVWQKKLLGFHWHYPVVKLRPGAASLIVNPRAKMGDQAMPILATQYYGKGQVLWLGTDETWRWRWNYQDKYFVRLWGQIIYQLGLPSLLGDGAKRASMALDHSQAIVGKQSTVYVRLLDKDHNPRKDAKVDAELEFLDARQGEERRRPLSLYALKGRPGEYAGLVVNDRPGRVEVHVNNPEVNTFSFRVELPPRHELEESGLNEKGLRDAAEVSGGRFYREEDLHRLASGLTGKKAVFHRRQEVLLWNPLAICLFVGLITAEWLVRKFSDLS